jgi:hypothetical protein
VVALVVVSTFVVLVLGVLVAGLLRSHADILRSLHELGVGVGDPASAADARPGPAAPAAVALGPTAGARALGEAATVAGVTPAGDAAADGRVAGFRLPVHRRQVNERWLDQFCPWVYGAGFGWQIGTGLVTYIKTSAVYLMIVLAALTGDPLLALAIGALFGLVRGLAVLLGRTITNPAALAGFHRRFTELRPVVLGVVVAVEVPWRCSWRRSCHRGPRWSWWRSPLQRSWRRHRGRAGRCASERAQPRMLTALIRTGTIRTTTRRTPGPSCSRRSVPPYLVPTLSANS